LKLHNFISKLYLILTLDLSKFTFTVILILSVLVITISVSQENAFGSKSIPWDENRKLTWDDFQGNVYSLSPNQGAVIDLDLSLRHSWKYSETSDCNYEFDKISAIAYFGKKSFVRPWVLESQHSSWILNHEQRHFDITEIHAGKFNEQVASELLGEKFSCPSFPTELNSLKSKISTIALKQVREIFDEISRSLKRTQGEYDRDTDHSLDHKSQILWNYKIDSQLKTLKENAQKQKVMNELQTSRDLGKLGDGKEPNFDFFQSNPRQIRINENIVTHLITGKIPENIFTRGIPLYLFIQFPDSTIKEFKIPVTAQKFYKYPLQFDSQTKIGQYKLVLHYKNKEIHSELLVVGSKNTMNQFEKQNMFTMKSDCKSNKGCVSSQRFFKDETATLLISGHVPKMSLPVSITIKSPSGHRETITVPSKLITDDKKYYEHLLEFNWESERGKYEIYVEYYHHRVQGVTIHIGPEDKIADSQQPDKLKPYNVKSEYPNIVKSTCSVSWMSAVCDHPQSVIVKKGEITTFLISDHLSNGFNKKFDKRFPIETIIEYPNSEIKIITTKLDDNFDYEIPLQFSTHSMNGKYKIIVEQKGQFIRSEVLNVQRDDTCDVFRTILGCSEEKTSSAKTVAIPEKGKKTTQLISGFVPENLYSQKSCS